MRSTLRGLGPGLMLCGALLLLAACGDDSQSPPARVEPRAEQVSADEPGNLAPLDLVYVCGNKFLATNSNRSSVQLTWRVVGSSETGSITLPPGPIEDPGHSETELETAKKGIVELYQDGERVVRRRNLNRPCGAPAVANLMASATAADAGSWTQPFPWPSVAIHLSLLPTGKVLSWGNLGQPVVWDPETGQFTEVPSQEELFCSGHTLLPDGRVLVAGGHISSDHGIPDISIFSPSTGSWTKSAPMRRGRWYPTNTVLANGSVLITAGRDQVGDEVAEPEVWSSSGIRQLNNASLVLPYYPRTFVAPNGLVFYAGEQTTSRYLNTAGNGSWTTVGSPTLRRATLRVRRHVRAGQDPVCRRRSDDQHGGDHRPERRVADLAVDRLHGVRATEPERDRAPDRRGARHRREQPSGVQRRDPGDPGGGDVESRQRSLDDHGEQLGEPDLSLHVAAPAGRTGAPHRKRRGRRHAGGAQRRAVLAAVPVQGARPTITDAPTLVGWGTTFSVQTPDAANIAKVSLIRLGSVTHAFDMNGRLLWLSFSRQAGSLTIAAPANGSQAPPGHYMLFLVNQNGVPSVARIVKVSAQSEPSPGPNAAPSAAFLAGCGALNCNFADKSSDPDGNLSEWQWSFGDGQTSSARDPSHAYGSGGSYTVRTHSEGQRG